MTTMMSKTMKAVALCEHEQFISLYLDPRDRKVFSTCAYRNRSCKSAPA